MTNQRILLFILFVFPWYLFADSGLELIHADKSIGREANGEQLHIFTGDVHFRQDTLEMFCDEAVLYEVKDILEFKGSVLVSDGHRRIRAKKIDYYIESHEAFCYESVRIRTNEDSLYAEYVTYNFKTDHASAKENIYIYNAENMVEIWGQDGIYNPDLKYSVVRTEARLTKIDTSSKDTLTITADRLEYFGGEEPRAVGIDSVVILQGKLKAVCDSAVYFTKSELVLLNKNPYAWYEDSELSGINMQAQFDSLKLKSIFVSEDAKAISRADSVLKRNNVLMGKTIEFQIEEDQPKLIIASENASSIYYLNKDGQDQGSNFATSDTIMVYFAEGELDSIKIIGGSEGIFYPSDYKGVKVFEN